MLVARCELMTCLHNESYGLGSYNMYYLHIVLCEHTHTHTMLRELVVVFDCQAGHCMCVECFKEYCKTQLQSRQFIQKPSVGYTLRCPNHCEGSEVTEMHHFRMLGKDLVKRRAWTINLQFMFISVSICLCVVQSLPKVWN